MVRGKDVVSLTTITVYVLIYTFYDVIYNRILIYGDFRIELNFEF